MLFRALENRQRYAVSSSKKRLYIHFYACLKKWHFCAVRYLPGHGYIYVSFVYCQNNRNVTPIHFQCLSDWSRVQLSPRIYELFCNIFSQRIRSWKEFRTQLRLFSLRLTNFKNPMHGIKHRHIWSSDFPICFDRPLPIPDLTNNPLNHIRNNHTWRTWTD